MKFLFKVNLNPGVQPVVPVLPSPTPTRTCTPTVTPTITLTPSITPTITPTQTFTPTKTTTPTVTPTVTKTPTITPTPTPNSSPTPTPSSTLIPPSTPTRTPTPTITLTPEPTFNYQISGPEGEQLGIFIASTSNQIFYFNNIDPGGLPASMIISVGGVQQMQVTFGSNRLRPPVELFGFRLTPGGTLYYTQFVEGIVDF